MVPGGIRDRRDAQLTATTSLYPMDRRRNFWIEFFSREPLLDLHLAQDLNFTRRC